MSTTLIMSEEFLTIDKQIELEIKKFNVADSAIEQLKTEYSDLVIEGRKDKEGYELVRKARAEVRSYRTGIEKKRKELKSDYLTIGRKIDEEAARLTDLLSPLETDLDKKLDVIDQEIAGEKKAAEEARLKKKNERIAELTSRRMVYFDGKFQLNTMSIDAQQVEFAEDAVFEKLLEAVEAEYQKDLAKEREAAEQNRLEEERIEAEKEAEQQRMQAEREELLKMRGEQQELEKQIKAEQEKLRKDQQAREDALIADQNKLEAERKALRDQRISQRTDQLKAIGMDWNGGGYGYKSVIIYPNEIASFSEQEFSNWLNNATLQVKEIKADEAKQELQRIERLQKEAAEKALRDKEDAERLAKEAEAERIALASDKVKFQEVYNQLSAITFPDMKSVRSRKIAKEVADIIANAQAHINTNILKK